jgi:hypothetical protein
LCSARFWVWGIAVGLAHGQLGILRQLGPVPGQMQALAGLGNPALESVAVELMAGYLLVVVSLRALACLPGSAGRLAFGSARVLTVPAAHRTLHALLGVLLAQAHARPMAAHAQAGATYAAIRYRHGRGGGGRRRRGRASVRQAGGHGPGPARCPPPPPTATAPRTAGVGPPTAGAEEHGAGARRWAGPRHPAERHALGNHRSRPAPPGARARQAGSTGTAPGAQVTAES